MTERYDAAIIGAGADGLAAAILLARAGLRTIVLERHTATGGRLATRAFHPGFFASPYASELAPIPDALFWSLDLAHHGAIRAPAHAPAALWPDRIVVADTPSLLADADNRRTTAMTRASMPEPPPRWSLFAKPAAKPWPAESWTHRPLADLAADEAQAALLAAAALEGRAADPLAAGSALHLLAPSGDGLWRGGLGGLGAALDAAARAAGAQISCGLEVGEIACAEGRVASLTLSDGSSIAARAVLSTLDLKRTFLSLFPWAQLPKPAVKRIGDFRCAGSAARLLLALAALPSRTGAPPDLLRRPLHVAPDIAAMVEAYAAWRAGIVAEKLPLTLRVESATDPGLAPPGAAVMTVTIGCVPHTPFDGAWTHEKRTALLTRTLAAIERVFPGLTATILAYELIVPPDIEAALGATAGDLCGGEIAPDQMFAFRPGLAAPVKGLYLAGPSSAAGPLATCASGAIAAEALIADFRAGRLT